MSEEHGDELNFNELVGSLLSSHNATENHASSEVEAGDADMHTEFMEEDQEKAEHLGEELPDFGGEEEDDALAAVVASAIQSMDHVERDEDDGEDEIPRNDSSGMEQETEDSQQDRHWANMLQQSMLQGSDVGKHQTEEQLDQDDETLRRAILESLGELNTVEREPKDEAPEGKERPKKSLKKKKKKDKEHSKEKHTSTKKKKHHRKEKEIDDQGDDLLDFEDVIKGFMKQGNEASSEASPQPEAVGDAETQALVEATLKAFERELLGSQASAVPSHVSKAHPKTKELATESVAVSRKDNVAPTAGKEDISKIEVPSTASKKKKKKKKKKKQPQKVPGEGKEDLDEDDFSKALAAMVNEVVNTSLVDETAQVPQEEPSLQVTKAAVKERNENEHHEPEEDTFDLNQIMQKAMSMAFQDQNQGTLDTAAMEEFNRGLGDLSVSDLLSGSSSVHGMSSISKTARASISSKAPKVSRRKTSAEIEDEPSKRKSSTKPSLSAEEALRKKYSQAATAAAATARKQITARNKATRLELRTERKKAREEKKLQKKYAKEQLELERKELEEIVARGPPYPPDLRLTKSGKPKKPYRRWTQEEMEKRASMPPEELERPRKVKKAKKKKSKKLKKVPLATLKKIPLFNFARENVVIDAKTKLNGIDETLKQIPLQSYQSDISRLAPPDTVPPGVWEKERKFDETIILNEKSRRGTSSAFDAGRKTVVRREKIPFHPPWNLPRQVPYALPQARRKRKEKPRDAPSTVRVRRRAGNRSERLPSSVRNKIIPAVLLPIINTLKAAARAKVASGASPEEANSHLVTIIKHTKRSIAETLSLARKHSTRRYSAIKSEKKVHHSTEIINSRAARIPIFSLSKIRQIDTSEDSVVKPTEPSSVEPQPAVVKIEDEEASGVPRSGIDTTSLKPSQEDVSKSWTGESGQVVLNQESILKPQERVSNPNPKEERIEIRRELESPQSNSSTHVISPTEREATRMAMDHDQETTQTLGTSNVADTQDTRQLIPDVLGQGQELLKNKMQPTTIKEEASEGMSLGKGSLESLKHIIVKSNVGKEQKVHEVLDDLVKEHLAQSKTDSVELPDSVRNILSATIEELIPVIDGQQNGREEKPRRHRKGPPPVLNLDGLVPPNSLRVIPKVESTPSPLGTQKITPKIRKPRKKADQPVLLYKFNVPDLRNAQGRRTMLLKRTKEYLTGEEMNILKKEINKERKRKWREANVEKNWENDLRARLKKRANAKFGDQDSIEKGKWYQDELTKSLTEREMKQEGNDETPEKRSGGSTNLSDNEVLNMIATTLNKLEVARILERELNEEVTGYQDERQMKRTRPNTDLESPEEQDGLHSIKQPTLQISVPSYDEGVTYDGQEPHNDNGEVLDESGNTKRPYPDDIPVTVPLIKRPKCLSAEQDK